MSQEVQQREAARIFHVWVRVKVALGALIDLKPFRSRREVKVSLLWSFQMKIKEVSLKLSVEGRRVEATGVYGDSHLLLFFITKVH